MKRIAVVALLLLLATAGAQARKDVRYANPVLAGVRANVVVVNLKSANLTVRPMDARASNEKGRRVMPFSYFARNVGCIAAINGTFFDTRTRRTIGSMVFDGEVVHHGYVGNALAIDRDARPHFLKINRKSVAAVDWSPYLFAITSGPTLIHRGRIALNPRAEGFRDPRLYGKARRSAIGFRKNGEMVLVTVHKPVYLGTMAKIMRTLKVEHALNLDGGSSSGLYYRGKTITRPKRRITNILAVLPR